jgi:hypothetical protein
MREVWHKLLINNEEIAAVTASEAASALPSVRAI